MFSSQLPAQNGEYIVINKIVIIGRKVRGIKKFFINSIYFLAPLLGASSWLVDDIFISSFVT